MAQSVIGDIKTLNSVAKKGVVLHNIPNYLQTDAAVLADILNDKAQSGKRLGAQVVLVDDLDTPTKAGLYVAAGSEPDSTWQLAASLVGVADTTVTPV